MSVGDALALWLARWTLDRAKLVKILAGVTVLYS